MNNADPLRYKMTLDLLRDEILDLTCDQIAEKLSDKFVEKYGDFVMEKAWISDDELRRRVIEKLSDKIINNFIKEEK